MGGGIAWLFSKNDYSVRLKDIEWNAVNKGYQTAFDYYSQMKRYRKITPIQIRNKMNHLAGCINYNGFKNIDLICEALTKLTVLTMVCFDVFLPGIISTKGILFTGLKKCMPMKFSGRFNAVAISVTDKLEVLEVIRQCSGNFASASASTVFLISIFSTTASQ
jgi:hypothetical protein